MPTLRPRRVSSIGDEDTEATQVTESRSRSRSRSQERAKKTSRPSSSGALRVKKAATSRDVSGNSSVSGRLKELFGGSHAQSALKAICSLFAAVCILYRLTLVLIQMDLPTDTVKSLKKIITLNELKNIIPKLFKPVYTNTDLKYYMILITLPNVMNSFLQIDLKRIYGLLYFFDILSAFGMKYLKCKEAKGVLSDPKTVFFIVFYHVLKDLFFKRLLTQVGDSLGSGSSSRRSNQPRSLNDSMHEETAKVINGISKLYSKLFSFDNGDLQLKVSHLTIFITANVYFQNMPAKMSSNYFYLLAGTSISFHALRMFKLLRNAYESDSFIQDDSGYNHSTALYSVYLIDGAAFAMFYNLYSLKVATTIATSTPPSCFAHILFVYLSFAILTIYALSESEISGINLARKSKHSSKDLCKRLFSIRVFSEYVIYGLMAYYSQTSTLLDLSVADNSAYHYYFKLFVLT